MKPEVKQNIVILTSFALVAGFFFPIQFVYGNVAAGICEYDDVRSGVNFESWGFNTRCVQGPPNEYLFELAPGITLGIISFTVS